MTRYLHGYAYPDSAEYEVYIFRIHPADRLAFLRYAEKINDSGGSACLCDLGTIRMIRERRQRDHVGRVKMVNDRSMYATEGVRR